MADSSIANRDSAEQCISLAREAAKQNLLDKAIRLLQKSLRLFPTDEAESLLAAFTLRSERQHSEAASAPARQSSSEATMGSRDTHGPIKQEYLAEEQAEALKVVKTSCYYTRLGVEKTATKIELKRAYKRRAMQFHPDKNHAPASADAFKAVSEAHQVLSNEDSRRAYDLYGVDGVSSHARASGHGGGGTGRGMFRAEADDLTPEDILHMFFSGRPRGPQQASFSRRQEHPSANGTGMPYAYLFQFLPVLLLVLFSLLSGPSSGDMPFRLQRSEGFGVARTTAAHEVPYFVSDSFARWYERDRRAMAKIESMVEQEHMQNLKQQCQQQKKERSRAIYHAKKSSGEGHAEALTKAYEMAMPSCAALEAFYSAAA